jgi:hypothetical protein
MPALGPLRSGSPKRRGGPGLVPLLREFSVLLLFVSALTSCNGEERVDERIELGVGEETFTVEVARSPEERQRGLMHRSSLGENEGMLFVFETDQHLSFWMKDTEIPLSLAYISKDGTIREIHDLQPYSERPVQSGRAVRYALELPRGAFERAGAGAGTVVEFPEGWRH